MIMDGSCSSFQHDYPAHNVALLISINAKADPIEEQASRAISPSAFDTAIEEFRSGAAESESEMEEEDN